MSEQQRGEDRGPDALDEDLRALSARLAALRYVPVAGRWEALAAQWKARVARRRRWRFAAALAAGLAVGAVAALLGRPTGLPVVVTRDGASRHTRLSAARWLETGAGEVARVSLAGLGTVRLDPGSKLRLTASGPTEQRFELERGDLHAAVRAPPRLLVVDTPHASAVDLGCVYRLTVADAEHTVLTVEEGEVSLEGGGSVSTVLAGMRAVAQRGKRPGTPVALDAPAALREAVQAFDERGDGEAVGQALPAARAADAPTLWHLLARADGPHRQALAARLAALVPAPVGPEGPDMMQAWWEAIRKTRG